MDGLIYENHLKGEYVVENGDQSLIVTARSCYWVKNEAAWLIAQLPKEETGENYVNLLSDLGLLEARKILERLIVIGVLRVKSGQSVIKRLMGLLLTPSGCLVPARWQEIALRRANLLPSEKWLCALGPLLLMLSLILGFEVFLHTGSSLSVLKDMSLGSSRITAVLVLLLLGSLIHELGHSLAAAASGIGLRPIGFAIYLFFPVLYSNVSGAEKLPLAKKIAIDCGGLIAQSGYLIALGIIWLLSQNICVLEAMSWTGLMMFFNLNPLLRTDGYWLYRDIRTSLRPSRLLTALHLLYLALFSGYTMYLFYWGFAAMMPALNNLGATIHHPALLLTDGYKTILECYMLVLIFIGGMRRLQESKQELFEIKQSAKSPLIKARDFPSL